MTIDLACLGWNRYLAAGYARFRHPSRRPGRVASTEYGVCTVLTTDGPVRASVGGGLLATAGADPAALPCPGDWVVLSSWCDRRVTIEAVLPRCTAIVDGPGSGRALAANLDAVAVVEPAGAPDLARVERALEMVRRCGAAPLVILAGVDLVPDVAAVAERLRVALPDVPVVAVSCRTGYGLDAVRPYAAHGRTLGVLGRPGSGGPSLATALATALSGIPATGLRPAQPVRTAHSTRSARGVHPVRSSRSGVPALVMVPGGGVILDTPAVPDAALPGAASAGVAPAGMAPPGVAPAGAGPGGVPFDAVRGSWAVSRWGRGRPGRAVPGGRRPPGAVGRSRGVTPPGGGPPSRDKKLS